MKSRQRGAALAIALILLAGLGALALTAAAAAAAALALAGHQQAAQQAFEAAEAGIVHALAIAASTRAAGTIGPTPYPEVTDAAAIFEARIEEATTPGTLPAGFSIGEHAAAFAAQHYFIVADARASRASAARIEQGFYLVVPGAGP